MNSEQASARLRQTLRAALQQHHGRIREIERGLSRSEGYLAKFCRGEISIPMEVLFKALELLDIELGAFFSRALGHTPDPADVLLELVGKPDKQVAALSATLRQLATDGAPEELADLRLDTELDPAAVAWVEDVAACNDREQRRRLKSSKRYRQIAFARAYLSHLDAYRSSQPKRAGRLTACFIRHLVPRLSDATGTERLALGIEAVGVYATCLRLTGGYSAAAEALHFALSIAHTSRPNVLRARLSQRATYALRSNGDYETALELLATASQLFWQLDLPVDVAKTDVDRAMLLMSLDRIRDAQCSALRALDSLPSSSEHSIRMNRLAALDTLSAAAEQHGDLDACDDWLAQALGLLDPEKERVPYAKHLWHRGLIAEQRMQIAAAMDYLHQARNIFCQQEAADGFLVTLDLSRLLIEAGRPQEAALLAKASAPLLRAVRGNKIGEAIMAGYFRVAIAGTLSAKIIEATTLAWRKSQGNADPG